MKWFHHNKHDNNDDFTWMITVNKSGDEEMPSYAEAFVMFGKGL